MCWKRERVGIFGYHYKMFNDEIILPHTLL